MDVKSATVLKSLLKKNGEGRTLDHFLASKEKDSLDPISAPEKIDLTSLLSCTQWLDKIHYSWFYAPLAAFPVATATLFLTLFEPKESTKLKEMLHLELDTPSLSPFGKVFLSQLLKKEFEIEEILSQSQLPPSPLNELLSLKKEDLTHLIDFLGLYDLAAEMRVVVDRSVLNEIHSLLTPTQLQFLDYATKQPVRWIPPKLNLEGWDQEKKTLFAILHKRGLYRLAKACLNENESMRWHLIHRLDTGRGNVVMKLFAGKEDPAMIAFFRGQVLHLLKGAR